MQRRMYCCEPYQSFLSDSYINGCGVFSLVRVERDAVARRPKVLGEIQRDNAKIAESRFCRLLKQALALHGIKAGASRGERVIERGIRVAGAIERPGSSVSRIGRH